MQPCLSATRAQSPRAKRIRAEAGEGALSVPLPNHLLRVFQRWVDRRLTGTRDSWLARDAPRRISNPMSARFAAMKADMVT